MAGSEHSTSKTPGLAERPLSGKRDGRNGSMELPVVSPPERPSERRLGAETCRMACENYSGKADFPRCDICALGCDNDDIGADTIRPRQDHRNRVASRNAGCRMVAGNSHLLPDCFDGGLSKALSSVMEVTCGGDLCRNGAEQQSATWR